MTLERRKMGGVHILAPKGTESPKQLIKLAGYGGKFKPSTTDKKIQSINMQALIEDVKVKHRKAVPYKRRKRLLTAFEKALDHIYQEHYMPHQIKQIRKANMSKQERAMLKNYDEHFQHWIVRMADKNIGTAIVEARLWHKSVMANLKEAPYFEMIHVEDMDKFEKEVAKQAADDWDTIMRYSGGYTRFYDAHKAREELKTTHARIGSISK